MQAFEPPTRCLRAWLLAGLLGAWCGLVPQQASALDKEEALLRVQRQMDQVRVKMSTLSTPASARAGEAVPVQKRIAAGELSLRTRDYERAIDTFNQVLTLHSQGQVGAEAHAEALFLLAESYFESGQLLSARRHLGQLLPLAVARPYDRYAGRSLARLVDIAVRTERLEDLPGLERAARQIRHVQDGGALDYGLGKVYFASGQLRRAAEQLGRVPESSEQYPQSQYTLGAIHTEEASFEGEDGELQLDLEAPSLALAVEQFRRVAALPVTSPAHEHVVHLAWMALGRLFYESGAYTDAADAYIRVPRESPEYHEMLLELAWVYVRLGDYGRAQRALEFLSIVAPETLEVADHTLLRADLLLRAGELSTARDAYRKVRERFNPDRLKIRKFLDATRSPAAYYDRLVDNEVAAGAHHDLPELVMKWVHEEARGERVFSVIEDVRHAKGLLDRSRRTLRQLRAVLATPSRASAFPAIKRDMQQAHGLLNRLAQIRRVLALGLEDEDSSDFEGQLANVRAMRRGMMNDVAELPVTPAEFTNLDSLSQAKWNQVSQALQRRTIETDRLQAVINGLSQLLESPEVAKPKRFAPEIRELQAEVLSYRTKIDAYRELVGEGRVQIGFGDPRFQATVAQRQRFNSIVEQEFALVLRQGKRAASYARQVLGLFEKMRQYDKSLSDYLAALDQRVRIAAAELSRQVSTEAQLIDGYRQQWQALDGEARVLVGEVARRSFDSAHRRLESIVLRADLGVVQEAWEGRHAQQTRLRSLQRERALAERELQRERREVTEDGTPL